VVVTLWKAVSTWTRSAGKAVVAFVEAAGIVFLIAVLVGRTVLM
jgi:hypothetical protein